MMQCSDILQLCIRHLYHNQERTEHLTLVVLMLVVVAAAAEILKMMVTMTMKLTFFL